MRPLCEICGTSSTGREYRIREMMFGTRQEFIYQECPECGTLQSKAQMSDISSFYPTHYYSLRKKGRLARYLKNAAASFSWRGWRASPTGAILSGIFGPDGAVAAIRRLSPPRNAKILDVGCGAGDFLHALHREGFSQLTGIDPFVSQDSIRDSPVRLVRQDIFSIEEEFQIITLNHVFEHLQDPGGVLQRVRELLSSDGVIVLRTPMAQSEAWKRYGVDWVQLDAPRHLFVHTRKGIEILCCKAGLCIREVVFDSTSFQFWGSEQYRKNIPLEARGSIKSSLPTMVSKVHRLIAQSWTARRWNEAGIGDQACFYLTKS